ncbi:MAG: hypothetical protein DRP63_06765 [Planctomycetota bacterium]|nr:MAG: hypothetical protein DRP63_06765 [Planctomycetota bacterium]
MPDEEKGRLLTAKEVQDLLRISERTLRNLVSDDRIPHLRIGRLLRFDPNALKRWIEAKVRSQGKVRRNRVLRPHAGDAIGRGEDRGR